MEIRKQINSYGPEKRLEIRLGGDVDLRTLPVYFWQELVALAGARIISRLDHHHSLSFILSESSLFVRKKQVVLITCGNTAPMAILPRFCESFSSDAIRYMRAEYKTTAHVVEYEEAFRSQCREVMDILPDSEITSVAAGPPFHLYCCQYRSEEDIRQKTMQLLMQGIDKKVASFFFADAQDGSSREVLGSILPNIDVFNHFHHFTPQGYSENGVSTCGYYAMHISPENDCSYAGFESDMDPVETEKTVDKLVSYFKPKHASLISVADNSIVVPVSSQSVAES